MANICKQNHWYYWHLDAFTLREPSCDDIQFVRNPSSTKIFRDIIFGMISILENDDVSRPCY